MGKLISLAYRLGLTFKPRLSDTTFAIDLFGENSKVFVCGLVVSLACYIATTDNRLYNYFESRFFTTVLC